MATERNKWIEAVGKLLELTQDRELVWQTRNPPTHLNPQSEYRRIDVVYETQFKDRTLRLYELKFKVEKPNPLFAATSASIFDQRQYPYWAKKTVLELLDQNGLSAWAFPDIDSIDHLLTSVQYQVAGVKEFLDEILAAAS
jgi:hypothetical protein